MKLSEAIKHAKKQAAKNAKCGDLSGSAEHKQLAEWLEELARKRREDSRKKGKTKVKKLLHPTQPLSRDHNNRLRFKENKIVSYLLENGGINMNKLACLPFDNEDRVQLAQLIGFSLGGFGELSYVSDKDYARAEKKARS